MNTFYFVTKYMHQLYPDCDRNINYVISDVEDNIPAAVDNGLSANMDEDFETKCYQNNEGGDVPFHELGMRIIITFHCVLLLLTKTLLN